MKELLDAGIIILLVIAMIYGYRLNRRISVIQNSKKELGEMFKIFDQTILKAHDSVENLKSVSQQVSTHLQQQIDRGALMIEDISFVAERTEKLLDTLEEQGRGIRNGSRNDFDISTLPSDHLKTRASAANDSKAANGNTSTATATATLQKQKALETLLTEISNQRDAKQKTSTKKEKGRSQSAAAAKTNNDAVATRDDIANVLKALGYGDSK